MTLRRILVTGGTGQVGLELARLTWPSDVELHCPGRDRLDLASGDSVQAWFGEGTWHSVINCAAWTAVDAAEDNVSAAFLANAQGPAWLAEAAARADVPIVHMSTDYVFDGSLDRPYREDDPVSPMGAYGASKLAGELAVRAANARSVVLRTAWVLSVHRSNFLKTMLRAGAANPQLRVVADQVGCPTAAADIAVALQVIALRLGGNVDAPTGIYHFVNSGEASWHELATGIFAMAAPFCGPNPAVVAIKTSDYPTKARRPANSRLNSAKIAADYGIAPRPWRAAVADIVEELQGQTPRKASQS